MFRENRKKNKIMRVKITTPLLTVAAVLSGFSFPFTSHATEGSGSGSGSANEKPPMFVNVSPSINGRDLIVARLQRDTSRESLKRLTGFAAFLVREVWTTRIDFSDVGKGAYDVEADEDLEASEDVDLDNVEVGVTGEPRYYDIARLSYYGGPRDTPFRFCRLYDNENWISEVLAPNEVVSVYGAFGIECYALYYRGFSTSLSYPWMGLGS